jgi:hypothetical protein
MAKFPDGWRAGIDVPILFSLSQADPTGRDAFFQPANLSPQAGFIGHGFRNVNCVSGGDAMSLARCSRSRNSVTLELKQNRRLVGIRRE